MAWTPTSPLPTKRTVKEAVPPSQDFALFIDFLTELKNAGLLDTAAAKQGFVQTDTPIKFRVSDTDPGILAAEEVWLQTGGAAIADSGFFADRSTSTCQTVPPFLIATTLTMLNGGINAALAINKETKAYNQARFLLTGWTTSPTDMYICVWGTDGAVLGNTDSVATQASAAGGLLITGTFKAPLQISAGTKVYIGVVTIGGSGLSVARATYGGAVAGYAQIMNLLPNPIAVSMTGQTAALNTAPVALSFTTKTSNVPWIELI
jgi:hypothetical protein